MKLNITFGLLLACTFCAGAFHHLRHVAIQAALSANIVQVTNSADGVLLRYELRYDNTGKGILGVFAPREILVDRGMLRLVSRPGQDIEIRSADGSIQPLSEWAICEDPVRGKDIIALRQGSQASVEVLQPSFGKNNVSAASYRVVARVDVSFPQYPFMRLAAFLEPSWRNCDSGTLTVKSPWFEARSDSECKCFHVHGESRLVKLREAL